MRERIFRGAMNKYEYEQEIEWEKKSVVYERENILTNWKKYDIIEESRIENGLIKKKK